MTNGKRLHVIPPGDTRWARRFRDVLGEITSDLGGADQLSEGQRQLARRATTISIECEKLEALAVAGGAIDLDAYGQLTDRLGRAFGRLGLKRVAREVQTLEGYLAENYGDQDEEPAVDRLLEPGEEANPDPPSEAAGGETPTSGLPRPGAEPSP